MTSLVLLGHKMKVCLASYVGGTKITYYTVKEG
jgi:hypothetical protein